MLNRCDRNFAGYAETKAIRKALFDQNDPIWGGGGASLYMRIVDIKKFNNQQYEVFII